MTLARRIVWLVVLAAMAGLGWLAWVALYVNNCEALPQNCPPVP